MNGHGGNNAVQQFVLEWSADHPECRVLFHNWWNALVMFAIPLFGLRAVTPRPPVWLRLASWSGLLMTLLYIVLSVFPIITVASVSTFALKITMMIVAMNLVGIGILRSAAGRRASVPAI